MAHLVKLEDYVSRYQYDMFRYPSQFSRLKRERWLRLKGEWERAYLNEAPPIEHYVDHQKKSVLSALHKLKKWYKRDEEDHTLDGFVDHHYEFKYKTLVEVKEIFLKELYQFQLKWASSTLLEESTINQKYFYDDTLKWFLQSFPDNYLLLYYPVVKYPKAAVEFDILLISPTDIWSIVVLEGTENSIFQTHSERYWLEIDGDVERKLINPFLSLNRMTTILRRIIEETEVEINLRKAVITKKGFIDIEAPWSKTHFLDQRRITEWQQSLVNAPIPIKTVQLKFAQSLLDVCETTSLMRQSFEDDDNTKSFENDDDDSYN